MIYPIDIQHHSVAIGNTKLAIHSWKN
jgi:hypothetical protein